jgi:hypothetical protein
LYHDTFHRLQPMHNMLGVGIRLEGPRPKGEKIAPFPADSAVLRLQEHELSSKRCKLRSRLSAPLQDRNSDFRILSRCMKSHVRLLKRTSQIASDASMWASAKRLLNADYAISPVWFASGQSASSRPTRMMLAMLVPGQGGSKLTRIRIANRSFKMYDMLKFRRPQPGCATKAFHPRLR